MSVGMLYLITVLITMAIVGTFAYFIFKSVVFSPDVSANRYSHSILKTRYQPSEENSQNFLFIGVENSELNVLSLVRIDAFKSEVLCVPLPLESCVQVNTKASTLECFYEEDGLATLLSGVEILLGIPVSRYCVINNSDLNSLVSLLGGAQYPFPGDMYFQNPETGEVTDYKLTQTDCVLSGDDIRKIMTYPDYPSGREYNLSVTGTLTALLVNTFSDKAREDSGLIDEMFLQLMNVSETNLKQEDYDFNRTAFDYILTHIYNPATFLIPRGVWETPDRFVMSDDFLNSFREYFNFN